MPDSLESIQFERRDIGSGRYYPDDFQITFEYLDESQLYALIEILPLLLEGRRVGYSLDIEGSCCKIPQGVNWYVKLEFETPKDYSDCLEYLQSINFTEFK